MGESEQNCYSILARLFPGQTAASVMGQQSSVKKDKSPCTTSLSHNITTCHLATSPLQEVGVVRHWELLSRPLPPIKGDTQSNEAERKFHFDINHTKKKVL